MNRAHVAPTSLLSFVLIATLAAAEIQPTTTPASNKLPTSAPEISLPATPARVAPGFSDEQIVESLGWMLGRRVGLGELDFSKNQVDLLIKGLQESANGTESPCDPQKIGPQIDALLRRKQAAYRIKIRDTNLSEAKTFFEKLKGNPGVVELPSGLRYEILKPGAGAYPASTDTVKVNYTGKLLNDTVFDSSLRSGRPMETKLDRVIPGWTEGLKKINQGGKIRLYIPARLAYGDAGRPGIPPGSTLIFDVELLEVNGAQPPPSAPGAPKK